MDSNKSCAATFNSDSTYLMNVPTGSVDTRDNWIADGISDDELSSLVEVTLVDGDWVEK